MTESVLFYLFAALTLLGALMTITRSSAVLSAVWLTVSLLGVAGLFLLLGAEFLFVAQIIVYIGGVTLLFLFVIMLVNLEAAARVRQFRSTWLPIAGCCAVLAGEFIVLFRRGPVITFAASHRVDNTAAVADLLLSTYFLPFEIASVLLLAAMVGSVWMGLQRKGTSSS